MSRTPSSQHHMKDMTGCLSADLSGSPVVDEASWACCGSPKSSGVFPEFPLRRYVLPGSGCLGWIMGARCLVADERTIFLLSVKPLVFSGSIPGGLLGVCPGFLHELPASAFSRLFPGHTPLLSHNTTRRYLLDDER